MTYEFQVYNIMIQYLYVLQNDYHSKSLLILKYHSHNKVFWNNRWSTIRMINNWQKEYTINSYSIKLIIYVITWAMWSQNTTSYQILK